LLPSHIDIGEVDFSCLVHYGTARNQVALFGDSVTSITAVEIKGVGCLQKIQGRHLISTSFTRRQPSI